MPKAKQQKVVLEAVDNSDNTGLQEVQEPTVTAPVKRVFEVHGSDGGFIRAYTQEIHGENAEALANEFVAGHPGTKIV